ncbi:BT4734/BF3469 family protein [Aquimarina longa]|uniref:BT4734/BF3469 family protein n=1 Tax=Aquimarina longa TaxID=1080221 RepID=UPI0009E6D230|nr:BT4734/BF3469 family protein [Aquimarina longa]
MITRKTIISKTHYGLKIYSYILRQFYPKETVLFVNGKQCKPTFNPFVPVKHRSLSIQVVNNQAVYHDLKHTNFKGDVFNFAQLYFKMDTQEELLIKINDALHLRLENIISDYQTKLQRINLALEQIPDNQKTPKFSYYSKNLYNLYPSTTVDIFETYLMLTNTIRKHKTQTLRKLSTLQHQKKYKKNHFDYVTFSGIFIKRNNTSLIKHSGLLTIDIDGIYDRKKLQEIREILLNDPYFSTELLFTSPRGNGLKWIIRISLLQVSHKDYFKAVSTYLKQTYHIEIDTSGGDVSRGCLLPYDPQAYIHPKYIS